MLSLNSNLLSVNAQRRLGEATSTLAKSYNRLSSGLRITKASDDAAGLAISENLKTDSRLSSQALRNVNDGISMISIISSTLGSQKDILYRMSELAEQSSNGVLGNAQRKALQSEYGALLNEFDRIASSAKFNGISLLRNPDPAQIKLLAGINGMDESLLQVTAANSHQYAGVLAQRSDWNGDSNVNVLDILTERVYVNSQVLETPTSLPRGQDAAIIKAKTEDGSSITLAILLSRTWSGTNTPPILTEEPTSRRYLVYGIHDQSGELAYNNSPVYLTTENSLNINLNFVTAGTSSSSTIDISGLTYQSRDQIGVDLRTVTEDAETRQTAIGFTNLLTIDSSKRALDTVKNRIQDVSALEGEYGAIESRLSVAGNLLQTNRENFLSAASQITDADIATESAILTKTQILQQAATAVLSQANQQPALALNLLQR